MRLQRARKLDKVWSEHSVPDSVQMSMDLAVGEVAANIIEHAAAGRQVPLRMESASTPVRYGRRSSTAASRRAST
jgi:anti-sigma regulatory factor (Ser/Thr protein kinase)